nr:hypothetical protein [Pseudomonas protegens]
MGEWHFHPDGCPAWPSNNDEKLLDTLYWKMSAEGLPALMVIVGQTDVGIFVR